MMYSKMQAMAVATVNATYGWVASEAKRVLQEVLQARETKRRLVVTPPVACAWQVRLGARGSEGDAGSLYYNVSAENHLDMGVAA